MQKTVVFFFRNVLGQGNAFRLGHMAGFHQQIVVLLPGHGVVPQLSDGAVIGGGQHIVGAVQHVLAPDLRLNVRAHLGVNARAHHHVPGAFHQSLLGRCSIVNAQFDRGKIPLLGHGKIGIGKGHRVNQGFHHRTAAHKGAHPFGRVHAIHHRNNHGVVIHTVPQRLANLFQRIIFHTDEQIVQRVQFRGGLHHPSGPGNDLAAVLAVQHKPVFLQRRLAGTPGHKRNVGVGMGQHAGQIAAHAADAQNGNVAMFHGNPSLLLILSL